MAGMPRQAPASKLTLVGNATACLAGNTMNSAAVPKGLPLAIPNPYALADPRCGNIRAHRIYFTSAVAVRDHAWKRQLTVAAAFYVGRIDTRSAQAHTDLAWARFRQ